MNPKIRVIVGQAAIKISREMDVSLMLAYLELLREVIQIIPTSGDDLLLYCQEAIKEKGRETGTDEDAA